MIFPYPKTSFNIIDKTFVQDLDTSIQSEPLFFMGFSSDKGPEDLRIVNATNFSKLYGSSVSYVKHGQPLLQAANIVNNGGTLLAKRVVADDATLANVIVLAKVKNVTTNKTNAAGELLYLDPATGLETTTKPEPTVVPDQDPVEAQPIQITKTTITYDCVSVENAKTIETVMTSAETKLSEKEEDTEESVYPLFVLTDIGRGDTGKKFRITPDYDNSKYLEYMRYNFAVIESSNIVEQFTFTANPDIIEAGKNRNIETLIRTSSTQLNCKLFETNVAKFVAKVAKLSGKTYDECMNADLFFGAERNSVAFDNIAVDLENGYNLSHVYGLNLENGTNGSFGDIPFGSEAYSQQLVNLFNGTFSNEIYDLDNYKMDLIVDANYPKEVKEAIANFVNFREDVFYFRDLGTGLRTIEDILLINNDLTKSKFIATYHNSYDIIDPFTKKQVTVTIGYSLARILINHFTDGRTRPLAGQLYNFVIPEAIKGTVNFLPKIAPSYDQKQTLTDNYINYASYFDGTLVIETLFTCQENSTQLSFINNVLGVQEIIKAIRTKCPKSRYTFLNGDDLESYQNDVNALLMRYSSNYETLKMTYMNDPTYVENKVYYAVLQVVFKNFIQSEYFEIYTLNEEEEIQPVSE